jgi:membrane protease YdiL (CAAX protease family)
MEFIHQIGLGFPASWPRTLAFALGGLVVLLAWSPAADWFASRFVKRPPNLKAFRGLQSSFAKLLLGIVVAWLLGGFIEEIALRGVVLRQVEFYAAARIDPRAAGAVAVLSAAIIGGVIHLYQGPRAALITGQLSVLFGVLYVVSGHDLWAAILAHGLYDTIAFIRFAAGKSKYSKLDAAA